MKKKIEEKCSLCGTRITLRTSPNCPNPDCVDYTGRGGGSHYGKDGKCFFCGLDKSCLCEEQH